MTTEILPVKSQTFHKSFTWSQAQQLTPSLSSEHRFYSKQAERKPEMSQLQEMTSEQSWQSLGLTVLFSGTDTALSTQMPSAVE